MSFDTLCGQTSAPVGCDITFIASGFLEGDFVTFKINGVGAGSTLADANGDAALSFSSGIIDVWDIEAVGNGGMEFTWTSADDCHHFLDTPLLTAEVVDDDDVDLEWTAAAHCDPRYGTTITYDVYRDGDIIASGLSGLTFTDTDLPPGEYLYQVVATWDTTFLGGLTANSNGATVEIEAAAIRPPILVAVAEPVDIYLSWSRPVPDPDNGTNTVDEYQVEKRLTPLGAPVSTFTGIAASHRWYLDAAVAAGTDYYYTVVAVMSVTGDSRSNQVHARIPLPGDPGDPGDPGQPPYPAEPLQVDLSHLRYRLGDPTEETQGDGIDASGLRYRLGDPAESEEPPDGAIVLDGLRYRLGE